MTSPNPLLDSIYLSKGGRLYKSRETYAEMKQSVSLVIYIEKNAFCPLL